MHFPIGAESKSSAPPGAVFSFFAILAVMVLIQFWRLAQTDPESWLAIDYLLRVSAFLLLAAIPAARICVFRRVRCRIGKGELALWLLAAIGMTLLFVPVGDFLTGLLPDIRLGGYPRPDGVARFIDLTFGLALAATHEEVFFRRFARIAFRRLGDGAPMVIVTSVIFGLFHWWTGLPNMILTVIFGGFFMLFYRRARALWPVALAHYLVDFWVFL